MKIKVCIEDGSVTPDNDGRNRGWNCCLELDPEDRAVSVSSHIGSGISAKAFHHRTVCLSLSTCASGKHVRELLEGDEAQEIMDDICDMFEGVEWDGHNNVGKWRSGDDGCEEPHMDLVRKLEEMLESVPDFTSASSYIGCASGDMREEIREKVGKLLGEDRDRAIEELAKQWVEEAEQNGVLVEEDDMLSSAQYLAEGIMYVLRVDFENNAEEWWGNVMSSDSLPDEIQELIDYDQAEVTFERLDEVMKWCASIEGWATGPSYAPHPFNVHDE